MTLPSGVGELLPGFEAIFEESSKACRGVRSATAELRVAGQAGGRRLRARILAGLARPNRLRLEALAPFGRPVFMLVAGPLGTTLWLPRENRVLADAPAASILEALAGVGLGAGELLAIMTGCVVPDPRPVSGRRHGVQWWAIDVGADATMFLRPSASPPRIAAGRAGDMTVEYSEFVGSFPMRVVVDREPENAGVTSRLDLRISQLETNPRLDPEVFTLEVPPDADPISLDELRRAGPMGDGRTP